MFINFIGNRKINSLLTISRLLCLLLFITASPSSLSNSTFNTTTNSDSKSANTKKEINLHEYTPAHEIQIIPTDIKIDIGTKMKWFRDVNNDISFEQIKQFSDNKFTPSDGYTFNRGYTSSGYWFKFNLTFAPELINSSRWLMEIPFPLLDYVDLYIPEDSNSYSVIKTGDRRPFSQRDIDTKNFVFSIYPQQKNNTYYLHIKTQDSLQVPLYLWKEGAFLKSTILTTGLQGIYFGIMIVMVLYNLFLYISVKDRNYLYYTIYISCFIIFQAGLEGFSFELIWPNNTWWANISIPFFGVLSLFFASIFARSILNTKEVLPYFDKILVIISSCLFCTLPVILLATYTVGIYTSLVSTFVFFNLVLLAGILAALKGDRTAKVFVLAWSIFLISGVISMLGAMNILPLEYGSQSALQIGSAIEVILLSMALADRINLIEKEKVEIETQSKEVLLEANKQLESSNLLKNEFIATISHEVRTPMNGVLGSAQLLLDTPLNDNQINYVNTINHSGKTLLEILNNILDYSKIEANKLSLELVDFNIEELIEECVDFFAVTSVQSNVDLYINIHQDTPKIIRSDPLRIKQVLLNLISNAFKFTNKGQIIIRVLPANNSKNKLLIEVEDSGSGLSYEQQRLLFQPFVQVDSSSTRAKGGTGLGLAICKKLAILLGGEIGIHSLAGEGSTFWFTIDLFSIEKNEVRHLPNYTVLTLLGNNYQQKIIQTQLQYLGITIVEQHQITQINSLKGSSNIAVFTNEKNLNQALGYGISPENIIVINGVKKDQYRTVCSPFYATKLHNALLASLNPNPVKSNLKVAPNKALDFSYLKVLAVDDNNVNRMIIRKMLSKYSIQADIATGGLEALSLIKEKAKSPQQYDLILMDIEMPIKDGYSTSKEIRQFEETSNIPPCCIIAVSAHSMKESRNKAFASGMNGFLSKPIDQKNLIEVLAMDLSSIN